MPIQNLSLSPIETGQLESIQGMKGNLSYCIRHLELMEAAVKAGRYADVQVQLYRFNSLMEAVNSERKDFPIISA